ncbi:MAG: penicillin-binding transpeptidase domain-containing protein [Patescibacteria group bacterium]|nr:penicillin-binding transpeptidase domain-containing protein [Patescibacteria group bacterium]
MKKTKYYYLILLVTILVLVGRLIVLQVFEGEYYRALAVENRVSLKIIKADRGVIYDRFGEVLVRNSPQGREYIFGEVLGHVLGYLGEADENEIETGDYKLKDIVGKMGLEKEYDSKLRGIDGGILIEKDANGQKIREIGKKESVAGESLTLSIDIGLQRKAYELMDGRPGALIASEPETGEILALVSSPGFDFEKMEEALVSKELPLFNRAIGGEYPPGSVFKIVTATAGLEENKVKADTKIEDTGEIRLGQWRFGNWYFDQYGQKEGVINLVRAIARSNDIFFYKLGEALGIEKLADWAKYFGLGSVTEIDLPGEANGLMPNPDWKKEFIGEDWYLGDTYISSIGQGNILMTPLQVNQMTSVIASRGKWCQPYIKVKPFKGVTLPRCQELDISQSSLDLVTEGMKQVCESGGTAWPFFNFSVKGNRIYVAGKTGTAEFGEIGASDIKAGKTHAWFTGFAPLPSGRDKPVEKPNIVMTVLMEAGGEGSNQAAPVARDLLNYWFNRR